MIVNLFAALIKQSLNRLLLPLVILGIFVPLLSVATGLPQSSSKENTTIQWQKFDKESFLRAKKEKKFILLDLIAVWCHWCHVMEEKTYQDVQVKALINSNFIPVQADHDLRPDLADRYREWGWPAYYNYVSAQRSTYLPYSDVSDFLMFQGNRASTLSTVSA